MSSPNWLTATGDALNAPIEPWAPKLGDRVRVRLSGECWRAANTLWPGSPSGPRHAEAVDGSIGKVDSVWDSPGIPSGHVYGVQFDRSVFAVPASDPNYHAVPICGGCFLPPSSSRSTRRRPRGRRGQRVDLAQT